ncbi:Outer membrane protein assembly factor BamB, contains PQQ-like beta-propeller repeat [Haloplanus vescus]|uniref:Outer membrane protein assembly factor BamB, contains PQQ-like beta-propeller repeat n=2 Tax=Haloplanus vescus TaxID=555874 RepID=A0A1H3VWE1_9EURY|nr:Outer membrane protein assembly factor BamB, contains PQQ-like beta-propeller repeat [Haloplanus vescus]
MLGATVAWSGVAAATPNSPSETGGSTATPTAAPTDPDQPIGTHRTSGVTPARAGYNADESPPEAAVSRQWCVGTDAANRQSEVAVVDGTVLSATPEGLRALDARTGERQWRARIDGGPPTVRDGRVYVGTGDAVSCLGDDSGRELWTRRLSRVTAEPLLLDVDGQGLTVFTAAKRMDEDGATTGAVLHALDAETGETAYRIQGDTDSIYGTLAGRGTHVYGGTTAGTVIAFDVEARGVAWKVDLGEYVNSVAVTGETVFAGSHTGVVAALDRTTGEERWRTTLEGDDVEVRARPAVTADTVYVAATDGNLYAFDRETGAERWRFDGGARLSQRPAVVGADAPSVVFGSDAGNVFSVDGSGDMQWTHQLRDRVNTPPVVVDGIVYVGDDTGRLYALANAESNPGSDGASCRTPTKTAERERRDTDGDGVVNRRDYAPRDAAVQSEHDHRNSVRRSANEDEGAGFLLGTGVGAGASLLGVGLGYLLWGRSDE